MKYLFVVGLFLMASKSFYGQNCHNYQKEHCPKVLNEYIQSDLSQNIEIEPGEAIEIYFPLRSMEEYFISFCTSKKCHPIKFQIIDMNEPTKVIYDNEDYKYLSYISFENKDARKLKFIVSVNEPKKNLEPDFIYCLGVSIEYKKM